MDNQSYPKVIAARAADVRCVNDFEMCALNDDAFMSHSTINVNHVNHSNEFE